MFKTKKIKYRVPCIRVSIILLLVVVHYCLFRCTSVLSDDSEISTICDEEPLRTGEVSYCRDGEEVRPELLSSSEDSSPEADLPFSKKFLNVFVNSTSRSSSKLHTKLFSYIHISENIKKVTVTRKNSALRGKKS